MRRTKDPSTTSSHKAGMLAALGTGLAGALLLGACGGTSLPASHEASHTAGATSCHSFVSCLTKRASKVGPTASVPTQSQNPELTPSALGPLAGDLSQADQQVVLAAMDSLRASAIRALTSRLDALSTTDATRLGNDLSQVIGTDPADAQAYVDALVGAGPPRAASGAARAEMQAFTSALDQLPGALAQGNSQIASFVSQILSTTLPHIEQMMEAALSQVPAEFVPLALADVNAGLAKASPTEVGDYVALLEDPNAEALATRTAYQAGYDCGSTLYGNCSPFDQWVISVSGLKTAPSPVQQDIVGCVVLPLCTQSEYQGVISWVDQVAVSSSASAAEVQGLSAEMEANSYVTTERWMEAF